MKVTPVRHQLGVLIAMGSAWGLCEGALGMYLRGMCARTITGSVMTGLAIFFIAMSLAYSRKIIGPVIVLGVAVLFKLFDAYLLHLPILHGAVANPIFGFFTEALAFVFIFKVLSIHLKEKHHGKAMMGGLSALLAVNLFPLVGHFTGIGACVVPGTAYPLSLYYAPVAIVISMVGCPLGLVAGTRLAGALERPLTKPIFARIAFPAVAVLSLVMMVLLRIVHQPSWIGN